MSEQAYIKPSGIELVVNDTEETRIYARIHGWKKKPKPRKPKEDKPRQLDKLL